MKRLAYILLIVAALFPFGVAAQGISQLQQFTSTTSPISGITQSTYGKALIISGVPTGSCLTLDSNHKLTTTTCGSGGGNSFAYPFPSNATSTSIAFNAGLTGILTGSVVGNASTATALAANGTNALAGNAILGVDASGNAEGAFDVWTQAENTAAAYISGVTADSPLSGAGTSISHLTISTAGTWSGNAGTATALAANGANCLAGNYPLGVNASGAVENCTAALTLSSLSATYPLSYNNTTGAFTYSGLATTTTWTSGQLAMVVNGNTVSSVATGTVSSGTGISVTAGQSIIGSGLTITNTGVTSLGNGTGTTCTGTAPGTCNVNTTQNITNLSNLTGNGLVKTSSSNGTLGTAANGTDYTLVSAQSCTNQVITALTASGGSTCSSIANGMITNATIDLTAKVTGVLPIANGGTNASSFGTSNGITAYDGTRVVNFSGYTLTSSGLTATNASTTALSVNSREVIGNRFLASAVASSTWTATSTENRITAPFSGTLNSVICKTNTGTANVQYIINGTNVSSMFNASTTAGTVTFSAGNTFTKGQVIEADFGTPASTPTNASCTADTTITGL
jgi:hypothetical protein